jgi:uncharacterized damage-inducible protein DinB
MTLQEAKLLHAFNSWATQRIFDGIATLSEEQLRRDMKASHRSIYGTLLHLIGAEKLWLDRWLNRQDLPRLQESDVPTLALLRATWEQVGLESVRWLGSMTDRKLQETFTISGANAKRLEQTYAQSLQHIVDHGTYHRGQIVTLLRQLGVTPPSTGMIGFTREATRAV